MIERRLAHLAQLRDDLLTMAAEEEPGSCDELGLIGTAASVEQGAAAIAREHEIDRLSPGFLELAERVERMRTAAH